MFCSEATYLGAVGCVSQLALFYFTWSLGLSTATCGCHLDLRRCMGAEVCGYGCREWVQVRLERLSSGCTHLSMYLIISRGALSKVTRSAQINRCIPFGFIKLWISPSRND